MYEDESKAYLAGKEKLTRVISALEGTRAETIAARYSGSGDDGQIEEIAVADSEGNAIPELLPVIKEIAGEGIEDFIYHLLRQKHGGWEINEGSYGEVEISIATRKIKITHHNNTTIADQSEASGEF
jgi:hypothetical protein